ncbi:dephospho-CoA kinase [Clostridium cellulovorans]|uniref:Dephospho-CoA kinase n=1 Tax=Clostridium cellulovorans (strain ATCC 35296 / DSM 3052 / OCM 3 / 743B) TaxID=573061 RepID=D9SRJ7_CLOC7|nr:dephospho-CoA kinase [Clostridium cellulovorans]ADL52426.1 dephospho-CoA kinase [Clostridium cellulovorans 743B]
MIKVGITGGIGSGKSTISKYLIKEGYRIIDADIISREVLIKYPEILNNIRTTFGEEYFCGNSLNRAKLGEVVFKDQEKKQLLEDIIIPYIIKEIDGKFEKYQKHGLKIVFLDAPTLIENNLHKTMDKNILVWVDRETQENRVATRDKLSLDQVNDRIDAQLPLDEKKKYVDYIIDNTGSVEETYQQIDKLLKVLKGEK